MTIVILCAAGYAVTDVSIYRNASTFRARVLFYCQKYGKLSNPGGRRDFPHLSRPALGAHSASYTMVTGSFSGVKWPGRRVDHPPPSSAEVKEIVGLYLYSLSGP
jgi:hypothetical protein